MSLKFALGSIVSPLTQWACTAEILRKEQFYIFGLWLKGSQKDSLDTELTRVGASH